jgi:hypothetical protein
MVLPIVYGLFAGASAAAPIAARALNSPAANKLINEGAKLVGRFPKNTANRVANFFNTRLTSATQALAQDAPSGFAGTTTEVTELIPIAANIGDLGSALGAYTLSQVKREDFPTGLKDMEDVKAVVDTASKFDGVTSEQLQRLIEDHLIQPTNTEEN